MTEEEFVALLKIDGKRAFIYEPMEGVWWGTVEAVRVNEFGDDVRGTDFYFSGPSRPTRDEAMQALIKRWESWVRSKGL